MVLVMVQIDFALNNFTRDSKCIEKHLKKYQEITQIDQDAPESADYDMKDDLVGMVDTAVSCIFKLIRFISCQEFDKANNNINSNITIINNNGVTHASFHITQVQHQQSQYPFMSIRTTTISMAIKICFDDKINMFTIITHCCINNINSMKSNNCKI